MGIVGFSTVPSLLPRRFAIRWKAFVREGFEGLLGAQYLVPLEGKTAQMARRSPRAQDRLPLERGFARYTGGSLNLRVKLD